MGTRHSILVTGGAGFIGSNLIRFLLGVNRKLHIINLDLLTYAGSLANLRDLPGNDRHTFVHGDVADGDLIQRLFKEYHIDGVIHLAAESHVDRSINDPGAFIQTNLIGTYTLLEVARKAWTDCPSRCRFLHVSTDEVYGSIGPEAAPCGENARYCPNSPYAASKAGSDHLVRAYHRTYGVPILITNAGNTYGPFQYPEKLIPLMILNALKGQQLPIYGDGMQIRDWLYVEDHCRALYAVFQQGRSGEHYNVGGGNERKNIDVVHELCDILDRVRPRQDRQSYRSQVRHVGDRPGHDRRYAMDSSKIRHETDWCPQVPFGIGLEKTIRWYLRHPDWVDGIMNQSYQEWINRNYARRLKVKIP